MLKVVRAIDNLIDRIIILVFIIILLIGAYLVADSAYVFSNAGGSRITRVRYSEMAPAEILKELTEDAVAWIKIDDSDIEYPVMHAENNSKYLNIDPYGDYNLAGSIFLDCRNLGDFSEPYMILYGHHMAHGYMFGALDEWEKPEYFETHRTGTLTMLDGTEYHLNLFAFSVVDAQDENIFDPEYNPDGIHPYITRIASIYREPEGKPVMALTTCRDAGMTTRTIVFAEILDR